MTSPEKVDDPIYVNSRREATIILSMWLVAAIYTVSYCYIYGYKTHEPSQSSLGPDIAELVGGLESNNRDPDTITYPFGLGIPDWVFWGIMAPWAVCVVLTFVFCLFVFKEDDLGSEGESPGSHA